MDWLPPNWSLVALAAGVLLVAGLKLRQRSEADPNRRFARLLREHRFAEAGDVRMTQGNLEEAVELYLKAQDYPKACSCLVTLEQPGRAAELYLESGRDAEAGHYFQAAGEWKRAAECLEKIGNRRHAAELFEKAGDFAAAARCRDAIQDFEAAARLYERAGLPAEAATAWRASGSRDPAIQSRAAELFEAACDPRRAAECWAGAGEWARAAEHFEQLEEHGLAAQAYERAGAHRAAAENYERAEALPEARANYEKAGDSLRFAELSLRMGQYFEAGRAFYELGSYERAIESLQGIPAESSRGAEASFLLGKIFLEKGLVGRARQKLDGILSDPPKTRRDLEILEMLAIGYEGTGDALTALGLVEKIEDVDPEWPDIADWIARLQENAWGGSKRGGVGADARYSLRSQIGRGGMGVVHLAQDRELDRAVAIKFLPFELASQAECLQMFRQEARAAAAMNHPNIVHIYDVTVISGRPCIVMEYVQGHTVRQLIKRSGGSGIACKRMAEIARDTCDALAYAHAQKVIHRDVKPGNIIVSDRGQAKLMDFGISKILAHEMEGQTRPRGTPQYMPPEQILGRDVDGRTDLYALGISIFEGLTTVRPFRGDDVVQQQLETPLPDPCSMRPDIPSGLAAVIQRACAKDPNARYQSARAMADALSDFLRSPEGSNPGSSSQ